MQPVVYCTGLTFGTIYLKTWTCLRDKNRIKIYIEYCEYAEYNTHIHLILSLNMWWGPTIHIKETKWKCDPSKSLMLLL